MALFDAFASVAQALGSGRRAEIVDLLAQGERSVEEIANEISQSVANTSQHLRVLAAAGRARVAVAEAAAPATDRRLLPGSLLRLCRRRRSAAAGARAEGAPPGRRLTRVAAGGPAGRNELKREAGCCYARF